MFGGSKRRGFYFISSRSFHIRSEPNFNLFPHWLFPQRLECFLEVLLFLLMFSGSRSTSFYCSSSRSFHIRSGPNFNPFPHSFFPPTFPVRSWVIASPLCRSPPSIWVVCPLASRLSSHSSGYHPQELVKSLDHEPFSSLRPPSTRKRQVKRDTSAVSFPIFPHPVLEDLACDHTLNLSSH